jgi:hypothetical protein
MQGPQPSLGGSDFRRSEQQEVGPITHEVLDFRLQQIQAVRVGGSERLTADPASTRPS